MMLKKETVNWKSVTSYPCCGNCKYRTNNKPLHLVVVGHTSIKCKLLECKTKKSALCDMYQKN